MTHQEWLQQLEKEVFRCSGCGAEKALIGVHWSVVKNKETGKWFSFQCDECVPSMKKN